LSEQRAEDYPFLIAMEATAFAFAEIDRAQLPPQRFIEAARKTSIEVGRAFDEGSLRKWWAFSEPAQDMAWRGIEKEEILGAAVNTSEDPYIRATGYLVSEVAQIEPLPATNLLKIYNAYTDQDRNQTLHREMMETAFAEAIALGLEEESGRPFLNVANVQNEGLLEGRILGWCASALQAAAKAFENALANGMSPSQAARLEFEGARGQMGWDAIKDLGDSIVAQKRHGNALTLGHIAEVSSANPIFAPVLNALRVTMNDPVYLMKLQAANDLDFIPAPEPMAPSPSAPVLQAAPKMAPAMMAPLPRGPGMAPGMGMGGGGNMAAHMQRQRLLQQQRDQQKKDNGEDGDGARR